MTALRIQSVCTVLWSCLVPAQATQGLQPDESDKRVLRVCDGIIQLFERSPNAVWPGYDLSVQPLVVYRANRWALLLGSVGGAETFSPYPSDWPDLKHPARLHSGPHKDLAGELVFDFPVGEAKAAAIGVPDPEDAANVPGAEGLSYEGVLLGYIVHEAFHQYQDQAFGEIPWGSEEKYPILDMQNNALAGLEMHALMNALRAAQHGGRSACEEATRHFIAVRLRRWGQAGAVVEAFERGLEIREGTAKYVEVRALDLAAHTQFESHIPADRPLNEKLAGLSAASLLLHDFESRLTDGAVSPDDMPRNRVYPVAATQGYLLDYFGIDWKAASQRAGAEFSYVDLLQRGLTGNEVGIDPLVASAKERYDYARIEASTKKQIDAYWAGFTDALSTFEAQAGQRVEVTVSTNGWKRSRVSTGRKWQVEGGRRCLCPKYKVYVLTSEGIRAQAESCGVLELNDWEVRARTAVVFARGEMRIALDGAALTLDDDRSYRFEKIDLQTENVKLQGTKPGTLRRSGGRLMIDLRPERAEDEGK